VIKCDVCHCHSLKSETGSWEEIRFSRPLPREQNEFIFSAAAASEEAAASWPCRCCCPARYSPVLATAVPGACIRVCAWYAKALHLLVCVQGVIAARRVRQRSQRDVHGVRLRAHDADVLVYDISVSTCCGNFRASVALSRWVLCGPSLLDWSDAEYAFLFWMQGGVPGQFCMSPGMRWYTAVGLHTMQVISDKLRELTHYDHGASAVHQALHVIQNALQGAASHRCRFEENWCTTLSMKELGAMTK